MCFFYFIFLMTHILRAVALCGCKMTVYNHLDPPEHPPAENTIVLPHTRTVQMAVRLCFSTLVESCLILSLFFFFVCTCGMSAVQTGKLLFLGFSHASCS